jgi:hypothetical protein
MDYLILIIMGQYLRSASILLKHGKYANLNVRTPLNSWLFRLTHRGSLVQIQYRPPKKFTVQPLKIHKLATKNSIAVFEENICFGAALINLAPDFIIKRIFVTGNTGRIPNSPMLSSCYIITSTIKP